MSQITRVLVFGTTGSGKTSLCNTLTNERDLRAVSNSARGVTFESYTYAPFEANDNYYVFTDTVGLNENQRGTVPAKEALKLLLSLLRDSAEGYNLLIHVMRIPRITQAEQDNYRFFIETVAEARIPAILVATGCENIEPMSQWAEANTHVFNSAGLHYKEIICTCFAKGGRFAEVFDELRGDSREAVYKAIDTHAAAQPIPIYINDKDFVQKAKRLWNWFCKWAGIEEWRISINEALKELLVRVGFSREEAEELAENWRETK